MTTSRRRGGFRRGSPRRKLEWVDTIINFDALGSLGQTHDRLTAGFSDDVKKGATLVRTIVDIGANLTVAGPGGVLSLGLLYSTDDTIAALAFPEVDVEGEQPGWLWRSSKSVFTQTANVKSNETRFAFDLRMSRKFPGSGTDLVFLANMSATSEAVNIDGLVRCLFMR